MPTCSKCKNSTKGHPMPWGPQCTLEVKSDSIQEDIVQESDSESDFGIGAKPKKHMVMAAKSETSFMDKKASDHVPANVKKYNLMDVNTIPLSGFDPLSGDDILKHFMDERRHSTDINTSIASSASAHSDSVSKDNSEKIQKKKFTSFSLNEIFFSMHL